MDPENKLKGLCLKLGPLGENDRLLTFLCEEEGIVRLAIPGARRPKSKLSAVSPLTFLELNIYGRKGLQRVKQIKLLKSYSKLGENLESLAAAQAMTELIIILISSNAPQTGILNIVLMHLDRLKESIEPSKTLAITVQACIHLLALEGYCLPADNCFQSGKKLIPPIGNWSWRCSFIPKEGFAIGKIPNSTIQLNPSELALLQRLIQSKLPIKKNGQILGPIEVWLKLLSIIEEWIYFQLSNKVRSLVMLREALTNYPTDY